jgi:hypothetical protein
MNVFQMILLIINQNHLTNKEIAGEQEKQLLQVKCIDDKVAVNIVGMISGSHHISYMSHALTNPHGN